MLNEVPNLTCWELRHCFHFVFLSIDLLYLANSYWFTYLTTETSLTNSLLVWAEIRFLFLSRVPIQLQEFVIVQSLCLYRSPYYCFVIPLKFYPCVYRICQDVRGSKLKVIQQLKCYLVLDSFFYLNWCNYEQSLNIEMANCISYSNLSIHSFDSYIFYWFQEAWLWGLFLYLFLSLSLFHMLLF